jgi:predicted RecA/RadA family phage recombinase
MATNQVFEYGDQFDVLAASVTEPATPESGDPILIGALPAVALTDVWEDADGVERITVKTNGIYEFPVEAQGGNSTVGALLYYDAADDGLNNAASGNTRWGYGLGVVTSGTTSVIRVKIGY